MTDFGKVSVEDMDIMPGGIQYQRPKEFDLVSAKARFSDVQKKIDLMADEVERFEVDNDSQAQELTAILGNANRLIKDLDSLQKSITDPYYKFYKSVLNFKNAFTDKIKFIVRTGKKTLSDYSYKKEIERREAEKKAREQAERKQAELDRIAEEKGLEKVELDKPIINEKSQPIRSESATASSRMEWTFEVEDLEKVPRKYLRYEIDKKSVNEALKSGKRKIAGLKIYETSKMSIRNN